MSAPIVITVPTKYIPINLAPLAIKTESRLASLSDADESTSSMDEFLVRGKKRRLDHLTWEEKLQRKKLKNRVAAQTSRDRKKAKMEEMEQTIQQQTDQISELQLKCASLQAEKDTYYSKCLELESRQEELERRLNDLQQHLQLATAAPANKSEPLSTPVASHSVGSASTLLGSAASAQTPQQQGSISMEAQTTLSQDRTTGPKTDEEKVATLWKIVALCLLYRTCSKNSTCPSWKSSPKASSLMSQASWKELMREASRLMPKAQAPAAECLDQWWGPHQNGWNPAKKLIKEVA